MKTTRFNPKGKLEVFAMDLRKQISDANMTANVTIIPTANIDINRVKLNTPVYHTAPYDERYGNSNWYLDEEEIPGKKKGSVQIIPIARNVFDQNMKIPIKKSKSLNYEDWGIINTLINEIADHHRVSFNLKSSTHTVRKGEVWGYW